MKQFFDQVGPSRKAAKRYKHCPYCGLILSDHETCDSCQFTRYRNPSPGIAVLIRSSENRILIGRRKNAPYLWCLPCGFIESGENFLEAAHREVFEETGLSVTIRSVINVVSNALDTELDTLVVVLLADLLSGNEKPGDDIIELNWTASTQLPRMAFEADRYIIDAYSSERLPEIPVDVRFACTT